MMDDEPDRMDPRCDAGGRGSMIWMEYCNDGEYVRATDYDALAARAEAAEAHIAHLQNHIEAVAKDTHKIMVAAEAALPAVYRLGLHDAAERLLAAVTREYKDHRDYRKAIRALPIPTAAELMARINEGDKK